MHKTMHGAYAVVIANVTAEHTRRKEQADYLLALVKIAASQDDLHTCLMLGDLLQFALYKVHDWATCTPGGLPCTR
jgi:hypothetical protein